MKIAGAWSGHDCSYFIMEDGQPVRHDEYERFIREKEPAGDSLDFLMKNYPEYQDIQHLVTCSPSSKLTHYQESYNLMLEVIKKNGGNVYVVGHHKAHAANTFFSSNLDEATIITMDGGGVEENNFSTAFTLWLGKENKIEHIHSFPLHQVNIGGLWTRATRYIFKLQSGWPRGHQAGSVMAMAALGDPSRFEADFEKMLTADIQAASHKPSNQPKGALIPGSDPKHPYLNKWAMIADQSEQDRFDLAAGLQSASEKVVRNIFSAMFSQIPTKNLCLAGGVTLNSVMMGKIKTWFPDIENIYITPTPHDGGLPIGATQFVWHHVMDNPRIVWNDNFTPYLGKTHKEDAIREIIDSMTEKVTVSSASDSDVVELLANQNIVSVFGKGSESGRRALGNRSILADPRSPDMKNMINEKVKHRQWYRPFAPSILREEVKNWFKDDVSSPYMSFVVKFKDEVLEKIPAVLHFDNTARLQTVTKDDNPWYHNFLQLWNEKTGVPILLNTSFNDREPICETPSHAIDCFLRTNIDFLFFRDYQLLVSKIDA